MRTIKINLHVYLLLPLITLLTTPSYSQPDYPTDPAKAAIHFSDIEHFAEAWDILKHRTDTLQVLKESYFDRATPGLKEFINRHQLTPELLKDAISEHPERYALVVGFLTQKEEITQAYKDLMHLYKETLPNTIFAPTWLLVGANRGIGQASIQGQLITLTKVVDSREILQKLIVHELSHFQQVLTMGKQKYISLYSQKNNMLELCLREGGAEFITSLVVGDITQTKALKFIESNENEWKRKFLADIETQNKERWLWDSISQKDTPGLMGYAMGYMICKDYYDRADNKSEALEAILLMENSHAFLSSSGFITE